ETTLARAGTPHTRGNNHGPPHLHKKNRPPTGKPPPRTNTRQYWNEGQFKQLQAAPPGKLYSKGPLPWRLLAYLLTLSPEVEKVRKVIRKRLMDEPRIKAGEAALERMLLTLAAGGFVTLDPAPPSPRPGDNETGRQGEQEGEPPGGDRAHGAGAGPPPGYSAVLATPTPELDKLLVFRSIHPLYGAFLINQLGIADRNERLQAMESVLEVPRPLLR